MLRFSSDDTNSEANVPAIKEQKIANQGVILCIRGRMVEVENLRHDQWIILLRHSRFVQAAITTNGDFFSSNSLELGLSHSFTQHQGRDSTSRSGRIHGVLIFDPWESSRETCL